MRPHSRHGPRRDQGEFARAQFDREAILRRAMWDGVKGGQREPETNRIRMLALQYAPCSCSSSCSPSSARSRQVPDPQQLHQHRHPGRPHCDHRYRHDLRAPGGRNRPFGRRQHVRVLYRRGAGTKGWNPIFGFLVAGSLGLVFGAVNAFVITRLRVPRPSATLATLFIGRAIALYFSGVKMIPFGKELTRSGVPTCWGIPVAIWIFLLVFLLAWVTLRLTTFGRQVYAVGAIPRPRPRPASTFQRSSSRSTASAASPLGSADWSRRARSPPPPRPSASRRNFR